MNIAFFKCKFTFGTLIIDNRGILMKQNNFFTKFINDISLNETRAKRINDAYSHLEEFSNTDEKVSDVKKELYYQGSYSLGTRIKPRKENDEFDVDVILLLDLTNWTDEQKKPKAVIKWLAERLRTDDKWSGKIFQKERCVRVNYSGDFHLDIVPALPRWDSAIDIPDRKEDEWIKSDPKGYIDWFNNVDTQATYKLRDTVKLLKYWRDVKFGEKSKPKSILLTTLVGMNYGRGYSSLAEIFTVTLENIRNWAIQFDSKPQVFNPCYSMLVEDLARHWTDETFSLFKERIEKAAADSRKALDENDKDESIKLWTKVFPDFPQDISEDAKAVNKARKSGNLFALSGGGVSIGYKGNGVPVNDHRYYGFDK